MKSLSAREILKYDWRLELFVKKLKIRSPFELNDGNKVVLKYTRKDLTTLKSKNPKLIRKLLFIDESGIKRRLSAFRKNIEFNPHFKKIPTGIQHEKRMIRRLNRQIVSIMERTHQEGVPFLFGNQKHWIASCQKTVGNPKSDFHFISPDGTPCFWISYKTGTDERKFHQYGGVSVKESAEIHRHREILRFIRKIKEKCGNKLTGGTSIRGSIKCETLTMMAVYGREYGKEYGPNNVCLLAQGEINLIKCDGGYTITADHIHSNGDNLEGHFKPCLWAFYRRDRSQYGIQNCRISIAPFNNRTPSLSFT
jgi:hypothetical protein